MSRPSPEDIAAVIASEASELRRYEQPANSDTVRMAFAQVQVLNRRFALGRILTGEETAETRDRAHDRFDAWLQGLTQGKAQSKVGP